MAYFLSYSDVPDPHVFTRAFVKCGELAITGNHGDMSIAVPAKGSLQGTIEDVIGDGVYRALMRDNCAVFSDVRLHLVTKQIPVRHRGPVIAAWIKIPRLLALSQSRLATDIIYLPQLDDELLAFRSRFPDAVAI